MTTSVRLTLNTGLIDDLIDLTGEFEAIAEAEARSVFNQYSPALEQDLRAEPPPPSYPYGEFDWKSTRQQRKVMALLTQQAIARGDYKVGPRGGIVVTNLKYERTHSLSNSYQVSPVFDGGRFVLGISSDFEALRFVAGTFNQRSLAQATEDVQPFHKGRWTPVAQTASYWFGIITEEYRGRMDDRFGFYVEAIARRRSRL